MAFMGVCTSNNKTNISLALKFPLHPELGRLGGDESKSFVRGARFGTRP